LQRIVAFERSVIASICDARRHGPISRYTHPGGRDGWLITGYDLVRSVLADSRFSSRKEL
jgi:cytochrome P450